MTSWSHSLLSCFKSRECPSYLSLHVKLMLNKSFKRPIENSFSLKSHSHGLQKWRTSTNMLLESARRRDKLPAFTEVYSCSPWARATSSQWMMNHFWWTYEKHQLLRASVRTPGFRCLWGWKDGNSHSLWGFGFPISKRGKQFNFGEPEIPTVPRLWDAGV